MVERTCPDAAETSRRSGRRAEEPPIAAHDFTEKIAAPACSWNADTERAAQPNDPRTVRATPGDPATGPR